MQRTQRRRVPSHRGVPSGFKTTGYLGSTRDGESGRRRAAVRVLRGPGGAGIREGAHSGNRRADADWPHWQGARDAGSSGHAAAGPDGAHRADFRRDRIASVFCRGRALRDIARRLAGGIAGRHYAGDGGAAGGVSAGTHGFPRPRRLAHFPEQGSDPAHAGDRDAWFGDRVVRGQDRHAHRKPHGGRGTRDRGPPSRCGARRLAGKHAASGALRRAGMRTRCV